MKGANCCLREELEVDLNGFLLAGMKSIIWSLGDAEGGLEGQLCLSYSSKACYENKEVIFSLLMYKTRVVEKLILGVELFKATNWGYFMSTKVPMRRHRGASWVPLGLNEWSKADFSNKDVILSI